MTQKPLQFDAQTKNNIETALYCKIFQSKNNKYFLLSFSVFNTRGFLHTLLFGYSQSISVSLCLSFIVCCYFNNSFCLQFLSLFGHVDPIYYNYTFSLPISLSWGSLFIKSQFQFALFFFSIFHYIFSFLPLSLYSFHSLNSISLFSSYTHTHSVLTNCDA